jgi:hypothetical protein
MLKDVADSRRIDKHVANHLNVSSFGLNAKRSPRFSNRYLVCLDTSPSNNNLSPFLAQPTTHLSQNARAIPEVSATTHMHQLTL